MSVLLCLNVILYGLAVCSPAQDQDKGDTEMGTAGEHAVAFSRFALGFRVSRLGLGLRAWV